MTTIANAVAAPFPAAEVAAAVGRGLAAANEHPPPPLDGVQVQDLRSSAWQHLNDGDLRQASYKAWGLVEIAVKDISAQHGRIIHTHEDIAGVIDELARLVANAGDADTARRIHINFLVAGALRHNYYADEFPESLVRYGLMDCEEFSELIYNRFGVTGAAPTGVL